MNFSNNFRTITVNKTEGSVNATETWIASTGAAMSEDFEVSVEQSSDTPYTNVSINGTIQGLVGGDLGALAIFVLSRSPLIQPTRQARGLEFQPNSLAAKKGIREVRKVIDPNLYQADQALNSGDFKKGKKG